jgi:hypothetical protein
VFQNIGSLLLALALLLHSAHADWSEDSRQWQTGFESSPMLFADPHMLEVWTAVRDQSVRDAHVSIETVQDPRFETGSFKVALQTKRDWFRAKKAPLILYLPGLFDNMEDHSAMLAAAFFSERGYHVVVPSNPWSIEFLKHQPKFDPGTLNTEASVMLAALKFAIQKIGSENISRVEISGESYGAMLAAIAYAEDQQSATPLIDGNATFFSPPLDMTVAISNLDQGIDATQSSFDSCVSAGPLLKTDNECLEHTEESQMSGEVIQCSGPLVYEGFHSGLVDAVEEFHSFRPTGTIPTDNGARKQWAAELRFNSLLSEYLPQSQSLIESGQGSLLYWLNQLGPDSIKKVRIFTAKDDFLNIGLKWPVGVSSLRAENLMEVPWGGHVGYMQLKSFQGLLDTAFIASQH